MQLELEGMTCASCVARVERSLNDLDGVAATVNLATERATVHFDPGVIDRSGIVATIEAAGYEVGSAEEALDAIHAARAGHANDRQHELRGGGGFRVRHRSEDTTGEYLSRGGMPRATHDEE